uniref:Si:dkey-15h8.17 n=1 Tax=Seriola lalandi dorsalis TaxID=1841481 RepID=A0A3B4XNK6_SERLL
MNREDIEVAVSTHLPGLSVQTLTSVLEVLEELGVESRADLALVRWDRMPAAIRNALSNEARPSPGDRKDMVRAVVDQMFEHDLNPTRAICHSIARSIVRDYPKCFADVRKKGDIVGDGCHSLLQQIKTRVEYKNRNNTLARRRREKRSRTAVVEGGRVMARAPVDQYGCVRWSPTELPAGETMETLYEIKKQLCNIYSEKGKGGAETAEALMEKTYIIQRQYLNSVPAPAVVEIMEEWPFLFSQRGLYAHFGLLTDVSILVKLQEALNSKGSTIIRFCQELSRHPTIEDILADYKPETSDKAACVLLLLMAYFKEPKTSIMTEILPSTPCLIVQGDLMKPRSWMLSIEKNVVMGPHNNILSRLAALFASFYNLNLQYPEDSSCTLEFIQRYSHFKISILLDSSLDPLAKRKRGNINPHVSTFSRKLVDFEWQAN